MKIAKPQDDKGIKTICRDCIFAIWDDKTQVGCVFNKLEQYQSRSVYMEEIVEGKLRYMSIEALCCNARANSWEHADKDNTIEICRKEVRIAVDCIIMADKYSSINENVKLTVEAAKAQTLPFKKILLVVEMDDPQPAIVYGIEKITHKHDWEIVHIQPPPLCEDTLTANTAANYFEKLDEAINRCTANYYSIFEAGDHISEDWVESLDNAQNDHLHRFLIVEDSNDYQGRFSGLTIHRGVSLQMGNFGLIGAPEKLRTRLEEEVDEGMLQQCKMNELLTDMQTIRNYQ